MMAKMTPVQSPDTCDFKIITQAQYVVAVPRIAKQLLSPSHFLSHLSHVQCIVLRLKGSKMNLATTVPAVFLISTGVIAVSRTH